MDGADHPPTEGARPALPRLLFAVAVGLAALLVVAVHRQGLLVEPRDLLVHLVRDASLVVLSVVGVWTVLSRLPREWFG